jgi:hypothetical protein
MNQHAEREVFEQLIRAGLHERLANRREDGERDHHP